MKEVDVGNADDALESHAKLQKDKGRIAEPRHSRRGIQVSTRRPWSSTSGDSTSCDPVSLHYLTFATEKHRPKSR